MIPILNSLLVFTLWLLGLSICVDFISLESRYRKWESNHPGETYIRGYKRFLT